MGLLTDIETVQSTGPTAATQAKAIAPGGPIMDYVGNTGLVQLKLEEVKVLLTLIITDTDASDPNLSTLNTIQAAI